MSHNQQPSGDIAGLTDRPRMPRLGKIRLGIKDRNQRGAEFPRAVDYFVCPPEVQAVYGERPRELDVMFPIDDITRLAPVAYKKYSQTRGKICTSDGETAHRIIDKKLLLQRTAGGKREPEQADYDAAIVTAQTQDWELLTIPCPARDCPFFQDLTCKPVMILQFLLPKVAGVGVWQIDTGSINSIQRVRGGMELVKGIAGRLAGIPLTLRLQPLEVFPDGKKKVVHALDLYSPARLQDVLAIAQRPIEQVFLPLPEPPDQDLPDELYPQSKTQQTEVVVGPTIDAKGQVTIEVDPRKVQQPTLGTTEDDPELVVAVEIEELFQSLEIAQKNRAVLRRAHKEKPLQLLKILRDQARQKAAAT
ncbi:MAG: hypothetical protein ACREJS_07010 [Candidatus Rokuibacteriota bacterium]